ncbi:uncharacterized protein [Fopius arisanus]|nr:PREDICTED: uncharacterized protein LOC105270498 isoform X2 [Fopius arisanus]
MSCPVYASTSSGETSTSDYIPFTSTPSSYQCRNSSPTAHHNRKQMTNLYGGRGGRNKTPRIYNDHRSSRGSWNPFSPYDNRRDHHRDHSHELAMMRRKPIAEIINLSLILEDPWRKLINNSRNYTAEREKSESNLLITPEKVDIPLQDGLHKDNRHNESSTEGHWRLR